MTVKKILLTVVGIALTGALIAGASVLASPGYGTADDPLVTLSYIDSTVRPELSSEISRAAAAARTEAEEAFKAQLDELSAAFSARLAAAGKTGADTGAFSVVSVASGKTVACAPGTEIILRIGTASSAGNSSPRLIDVTDGSSVVGSGTALTQNHLYMVTIDGNGFKTSSSVKVLIRGSYKIG